MWKHTLKLSFRSLLRQKGYTLLNVLGLGLSMALVMVIAVYVLKEFKTDKFHVHYNDIYRLETTHAVTPSLASEFLHTVLPEALEICRLNINYRYVLAEAEGEQLRIDNLMYADSSFFNIFSFDLIHGDPSKVLTDPLSIVLSRSEAQKFFGDAHPVGQTILISNHLHFTVTGVMEDPPLESTLKFSAIAPFHAMEPMRNDPDILRDWNNWNYYTYVLLAREHDIALVNQKVSEGMDQMARETFGFPEEVRIGFSLRPLSDIYFNRHIEYDHADKGNLAFIMIYIAIGVFILIIAVINFINLSTAMAFRRAREVGLKKVMGSSRVMLIRQYLTEAILVGFAALLVALVLFEIMVPEFNRLTLSDLQFSLWDNPGAVLALLGFAVFTGLVSGMYPAFYLTRFDPVRVLKGEITKGKRGGLLRKILIVFQFTISIGIILSTLVIYNQMQYAYNKDLGYEPDHIVYFTQSAPIRQNFEAFRTEIKQIPGVEYVGRSNGLMGYVQMGWGRNVDGEERRMNAMAVDPEFMDVFGLEIIEGRSFDPLRQTDENNTYILNETAVRQFGLENPVGVQFADGQVIGVVKDFSYRSVHHHTDALVIAYLPSWASLANIRLSGHNVAATMDQVEAVWTSFAPDFPFHYNHLDSALGRLYESEQRLFRLFLFFSAFAIFVACLGLSGLALFSTQQRNKEVGIRKVLGSSVSGIVMLLTSDFMRWVLLANLIAWPIAWLAMNRWLDNFAYRISMQWWMFVAAALMALIIALATISFQAIRAAMTNPVNALKYE